MGRGIWSAGYCVCSLHLRKLSIQICRCAVAHAPAQSSPTRAAAIVRYAPERTFTAAQRPETASTTGRHAAAGHPAAHTPPRAFPPLTPTATHCLQTAGAGVRTTTSPPKTRESAGGAAGAPHLRTSRGSRQSRQQRRARPRQHAASKRLRGGRTGSHLSQGSRPAGPAPLPARAGPSPTFTTSLSAI